MHVRFETEGSRSDCIHGLQTPHVRSMTIGDSFGTFVDAVPLLDAARDELGPGEFVHDERLSLMDLMSAVEVRLVK